jgi:hypothetical protein
MILSKMCTIERPPAVLLDGTRQGVDADSDLAIPGLLDHLGFDTGMQGKGGRHPANPTTDNQDVHRFAFKNAVSDGRYLGISGRGDQTSSSGMSRAWVT